LPETTLMTLADLKCHGSSRTDLNSTTREIGVYSPCAALLHYQTPEKPTYVMVNDRLRKDPWSAEDFLP